MYVHIIHDQSDDIINKQQYMQKTGDRCVKVKISRIRGDCDLPSILGNSVGPAVYCEQRSTYFNHSWTDRKTETISNGKVELWMCSLQKTETFYSKKKHQFKSDKNWSRCYDKKVAVAWNQILD